MKSVTVIRYPANDGSLHETEAAAEFRNSYLFRKRKIAIVRSVVEDQVVLGHFSSLRKTLFPFGNCRCTDYDQNKFLDDLAELIIDNLSDITEAYVTGETR